MRKLFVLLFVIIAFATIISCEREDSIINYESNYISQNKVEPGTYHYPNQRNRLLADGCNSKSNATCVLVVTANVQPEISFEEIFVKEHIKDLYIRVKTPDLLKYLDRSELHFFKNSMVFNNQNSLISWDMDLLEKGAKDNFREYIINITKELGADTNRIVIVRETGEETIIRG